MPSTSTTIAVSALSLLIASQPVLAHIGIWHPSVYGFNATGTKPEEWFADSVNTNYLKNPLRKMDNLKFEDWWFHGLRGATPNEAMELPAGGRIMIEHSCNKAWTSYGLVPEQKDMIGNMPCDVNMRNGHPTYGNPNIEATNGPMHVADKSDTKGCGLAIAYTDDVWSIKPEDFTLFSVNHTCVWERETYFDIPADMPACPDGKKCICSWNWIHGTDRGEGYGNELYMNGFDCTVTNVKSSARALAKPQLPVSCVGDESKCIKGAKQALYWQGAQAEGWNIPDTGKFNDPMTPPFYNMDYGFKDGAQNDIFVDGGSSDTAPVNKAVNRVAVVESSSSSASSSSSVAAPSSSSSASSTPETESSSSDIPTGIDREPLITITSTRVHTKTVYVDATPQPQRLRRDIGGLAGKPGRMRQHRRRSSQ